VLVQGVCRARIVEEVEHEPYRLARLEPTESEGTMEIDLDEHRQHLEELFDDPNLKTLAAVTAIRKWINRDLPTKVLVDLATLMMSNDADERYAMLAEPRVNRRADWLERHLRDTRRTLEIAERLGSGQSEDGFSLN
jgi:Lon protease-like protein